MVLGESMKATHAQFKEKSKKITIKKYAGKEDKNLYRVKHKHFFDNLGLK
jgi:hypothetical protein